MAPCMPPLAGVLHGCDNIFVTGWIDRLSTFHSGIVGSLPCSCAFSLWAHRVTSSINYHLWSQKHLTDNASLLWYLSESSRHFNRVYPQQISWLLCFPTPAMMSLITSVL